MTLKKQAYFAIILSTAAFFSVDLKTIYAVETQSLESIGIERNKQKKPIRNKFANGVNVDVRKFRASNFAVADIQNRGGGILIEGSYIVLNSMPHLPMPMVGVPYLTDFRVIKTYGRGEGVTTGLEPDQFHGFTVVGDHKDQIVIMTELGVFVLKPNSGRKGTAFWQSSLKAYPYSNGKRLKTLEQYVVKRTPLSKAMEPAGGIYRPLLEDLDGIKEDISNGSHSDRGFLDVTTFVNQVREHYTPKACKYVFFDGLQHIGG